MVNKYNNTCCRIIRIKPIDVRSNFYAEYNVDSNEKSSEIDKIYIYKLKSVPIDLSKLSNVVNNNVFKKTVHGKLVAKINNIELVGLSLKLNITQINQT